MSARRIERLVFVFNADAGAWSAFVDSAKKVFGVESCSLCAITHGPFGENADWRACQAALNVPIGYLHRDELTGDLKAVAENHLPCIVAMAQGRHVLLMTPEMLEQCRGDPSVLQEKIRSSAALNGLAL